MAATKSYPYEHVHIVQLSDPNFNTLNTFNAWQGLSATEAQVVTTTPALTIASTDLREYTLACEPARSYGEIDVTPVRSTARVVNQGRVSAEVTVTLLLDTATKDLIGDHGDDHYLFYMERADNSGMAFIGQFTDAPRANTDEAGALTFDLTLKNSSIHGPQVF